MTKPDSSIEQLLHAYVDGELDKAGKLRMLAMMQDDDSIRERVNELRDAKESIKLSFDGERAPTRSLPTTGNGRRGMPVLRIAASFLLAVAAFTAGWFGHTTQQQFDRETLAAARVNTEPGHIILHLAESDKNRFSHVLARTEQILQQYQDQPVEIEIVANAGGLDLVRTSTSPHTRQIESMIARYDNVRFVACALGLSKLHEKGFDIKLINGVQSDQTAADHLIQRLSQGWNYIRI